ncbi:amiloride-sensitive sodium channel subunit beta-like [Patiria miniata]|uniref:Uncharacterized protein n=1 Tax=Patiria miniata TaxID=46514 RepID=A0A914BBN9_PATMI|nr:amiloride-sensitive sodium channel subunit beta-like [Patiria miniata]
MEYGTTVVEGGRLTRRVVVTGSLDYFNRTEEDREMSREKKKGALREAVTSFADSTTAHGLPLIINGTYTVGRIAWSVIWLIAFGLAVLQSTQLLIEYFQVRPLTTSIELVTKTNLDFPAVTVCNMNRMRRSELVGTRFEGLIAIDGGVQGGDYDYSWFFDWSSLQWFDEWQSSSSADVTPGSIGDSIDGLGGGGSASIPGDEGDSTGDSGTSSQAGATVAGGNNETNGGTTGESSIIDTEGSLPSGSSTAPTDDAREASSTALPNHLSTQAVTPTEMFPVTPVDSTDSGSSQRVTDSTMSETEASGPASNTDGASDSLNPGDSPSSSLGSTRRKRSTSSHQPRQRRSLSSSSSSSDNFWWDSYDFEYEDYYDWGGVNDENDWRGFYAKSTADDFSDLVDVANPTREELENLGHQAQDFILQCTFDKRNCSYRDFRVFQNKDYGNCFTFNHGRGNKTMHTTSKSGAKYGLHLTLFIEQPEYVGIFSPESGVRLTVHGQRTMPLPEDNGITIAAGLATSIGIRQDFISRSPYPFGNCTEGLGQGINVTAGDYDYSLSACTKYCLQREMLNRCGCVTDILIDNAPKCSYLNTTQQTCRRAIEALFEDDLLQCNCFTACRETTFKLGVSSSRWPSERYEEHLYSRISATNEKAARLMQSVEQTRKNLVRLRVYFEELNYQSITQSPKYTVEALLGSLGGLFGLYIGFSVITISEVVLFLLKLIKILFFWGQTCNGNEVKPVVH